MALYDLPQQLLWQNTASCFKQIILLVLHREIIFRQLNFKIFSLNRRHESTKVCSNSSKPPSSDPNRKKVSRAKGDKKAGGQKAVWVQPFRK